MLSTQLGFGKHVANGAVLAVASGAYGIHLT
jgi:hypothetical protein